jgi:very-short-patch-repair endonuclease
MPGEGHPAGKPGVRALGEVLDEHGDGYVADASKLERALFIAVESAGLPPPRRQGPLPGRGALEGLVDAAYHDAKVIIEADGRRWHTRIRDLKRDHQRDAEAARVGWQTLRFLYEEIMGDPGDVCAVIRDVCAVRMRSRESPASRAPSAGAETAEVGEAIATASVLSRQQRPAPGPHRLELPGADRIASRSTPHSASRRSSFHERKRV